MLVLLSFRDTFELVVVCESTGCVVDRGLVEVSLVVVCAATGCVDVRGLLEAFVTVGCEIRGCVVDKGLVEVSLFVVCAATGCVDVRGLLEAVMPVGCGMSGCVVDKGLVEVSLVVVCEVTGCVGVEVPSDDVWSSFIFKMNLFMNKKVKVQCVTKLIQIQGSEWMQNKLVNAHTYLLNASKTALLPLICCINSVTSEFPPSVNNNRYKIKHGVYGCK